MVGKFEPENEMELAIRDLLTHAKADKEAKVGHHTDPWSSA